MNECPTVLWVHGTCRVPHVFFLWVFPTAPTLIAANSDEAAAYPNPYTAEGSPNPSKQSKYHIPHALPVESYRRVGFDDSRDEAVARKSASAPIIAYRMCPDFRSGSVPHPWRSIVIYGFLL
jgi:hypothetical protein